MSNHKTSAQRHNDKMDKIWEQARKNGAIKDDKLFLNIRVIKAGDINEANGRTCNGQFEEDHELSDIVVPIENVTIRTVTAEELVKESRHLIAMLCETIETLDPNFYSSSDLIMYADDFDRLASGQLENDVTNTQDFYKHLENLKGFIDANSSLDAN